MSPLVELIRREPARVVGLVLALLGLLSAFGLGLTDDQSSAIVALVGAVLAVIGGETVRARVTPTAGLGPGPGPLAREQDDQYDAPPAQGADPVQ